MEERPKPLPALWRECPLLVGECSMHIRPVSKRGWNDADDEGQRDRASRKICSKTERNERAAARPSVAKEQQRDRASRKSSSETECCERAAARPSIAKEQQRNQASQKRAASRPRLQETREHTMGAPKAGWWYPRCRSLLGVAKPAGGQKRKASRGPDPIDRTENEGKSW